MPIEQAPAPEQNTPPQPLSKQNQLIKLYKDNLDRIQRGEISIRQLVENNGMKYGWARKVLSQLGMKLKKPTKQEANEWQQLPEEQKVARRKILGEKLDAGGAREVLRGFMWTPNDMLTANTADLSGTLVITMKGYLDAYGIDGLGDLGDYTKKKTFDEAVRYLNDLSYLQEAKKDLREPSAHWTSITSHLRTLKSLYKKYEQISGERITDRIQLEQVIRRLCLSLSPTIMNEIGTMLTLNSGRGGFGSIDNMGRMTSPRFNPKMFVDHE